MSFFLSIFSKTLPIFADTIRIILTKKDKTMKGLGVLGAFFGGAIAGAVLEKITDAVDDFMKKHNIKLSRKEVSDLVDDIKEAAPEVD